MKYIVPLLVIAQFIVFTSCSDKKNVEVASKKVIHSNILEAPEGYTPLFNGKDFEGWEIISDGKEPDQPLFSVMEGSIHAYPFQKNNSEQPFGGLITINEYTDYILTLEYKWGDKKFQPRAADVRDAGLLFHVYDTSEFWPSGAECQIQEGDTGDIWLVKTRGKSKIRPSNNNYGPEGKLILRGDVDQYESFARSYYWGKSGWNTITIEVKANYAKFVVNGKTVNELFDLEYFNKETKEWNPLKKGKILLQAEGAEVFYRNIFIKPF